MVVVGGQGEPEIVTLCVLLVSCLVALNHIQQRMTCCLCACHDFRASITTRQQGAVLLETDSLEGTSEALDEVEAEIKRLITVRRALRQRRNAHITVNQVPQEILQEVFCIAAYIYPTGTSPENDAYGVPDLKASFRLGHICRQWREYSLSEPRLWSRLQIGYRSKWTGIGPRSALLPLLVCMYGDPGPDFFLPLTRSLDSADLGRITTLSLTLRTGGSYNREQPPRICLPQLPRLREVFIRNQRKSTMQDTFKFIGTSLQRLHLLERHPELPEPLPWSLRYVYIRNEMYTVFDAGVLSQRLQALPNLVGLADLRRLL